MECTNSSQPAERDMEPSGSPSMANPPVIQQIQPQFCILSKVLMWFTMPYINIQMDLYDQLKYLCAAAHIITILFPFSEAHGSFIPSQLYWDIQIMVNNVFFCIAKEKIANPNGKLYIILLGTDQLETSFGILHTIIGNDANADILQLTTRLSHISEIQNILTSNPSWDCDPC